MIISNHRYGLFYDSLQFTLIIVGHLSISFFLAFLFLQFFFVLLSSNVLFCSFALTVTRTAILGEGAALFSLPFEARPVDSIRREVFRQQAAGHSASPWFAPSAVPSEAPRDLIPCRQRPAGPVPLVKRRRRM